MHAIALEVPWFTFTYTSRTPLVDKSIVYLGAKLCVRYMRYTGRYPAKDYLDGANPMVRARFVALTRLLGDYGELANESQGHFLKAPYDKIYELKPRDGRLFGFFHERNYYLTNGGPKQKVKRQQSDYATSEEMRVDFLRRMKK